MKRSILLLTVGVLLILPAETNAQISLELGGGVGYVVPSGDLGGDISSMDSENYGMDEGINLHAKARVGLLNLMAVGEVSYSMLSDKGTIGSVKYENSINIFSLKVGPEFHLNLPLLPIGPYVGANLQLNSFSGDTEISGMSSSVDGTYDMETATRYGIGVNGGVILKTGGLKIDLNIGYNMLNVFGKEYIEDGSAKLYLNDDEGDGEDSKALNSMEFKATFMFGI
ncbi:MAG: outer membrane beta-barrel protein [Ignavibacteria bacterium]